jgi:hypothetical protein
MENADRTTANLTSTFQVTTGPSQAVIGEKTEPSANIDVFARRFSPTGKF